MLNFYGSFFTLISIALLSWRAISDVVLILSYYNIHQPTYVGRWLTKTEKNGNENNTWQAKVITVQMCTTHWEFVGHWDALRANYGLVRRLVTLCNGPQLSIIASRPCHWTVYGKCVLNVMSFKMRAERTSCARHITLDWIGCKARPRCDIDESWLPALWPPTTTSRAVRQILCLYTVSRKKWAPKDFAIPWGKLHRIKYNFT